MSLEARGDHSTRGAHGGRSEHAGGDPHPGEHGEHPSVRLYFTIFIMLMVLLVAAIVAGLAIGGTTGTILGFAIGITKAVLIIMYFMHVRYGTRLTWIFATASFLWLGILLVMTLNDYMTRQTAAFRADPISERTNPIITTDQQR